MKFKKELIVQREPKSPVSEVFRTLRTNIQFMSTNKKLKTLLITSTFPGEGKSWVASNLAVTFAQAGNKVILIDADMRKGRQYTIFGASPRPGLSNYLSGLDIDEGQELDVSRYLQKTGVDNLLLMTAGNIPPNPSELLVSSQMEKLLEDLKEATDIIIIDGTPCELVTDSIILSRIVDSTVIVTAYKETKKDSLDRIIKNVQQVGGHIAGVVINKMPISVKKYNENYYYASTNGSTIETYKKDLKEGKGQEVTQENKKEENYKNMDVKESNVDDNSMEKPEFIKESTDMVNKRTKDILQQMDSYLNNKKQK